MSVNTKDFLDRFHNVFIKLTLDITCYVYQQPKINNRDQK